MGNTWALKYLLSGDFRAQVHNNKVHGPSGYPEVVLSKRASRFLSLGFDAVKGFGLSELAFRVSGLQENQVVGFRDLGPHFGL